MTYLAERQIKAHNNGERFKTWDFTDGKLLLNSKSKVLISTNMRLVRTLEKFLSCYNGVVPDVCTNMTDYTSNEILDDLAEYGYDLIVTNPPYSTYTNSQGLDVVNPAQIIIDKTSNYLSKNGQIVILCRSMDV